MKKNMHDKGFQYLVTAIVKCAVEDYVEEYKKYLNNPTEKNAHYIKLLRNYFEENCAGLTSCGEAIVERAERIVREGFSKDELMKADKMYDQMLEKAA